MPAPVMPPPPPAVTTIDPTLTPSTPTSASIQVQITALGSVVNAQLASITVRGLSPASLTGAVPMSLAVGGSSYTVDSVTVLANGDCRLTVLGGINPNGANIGGTAQVSLGSGTYVPNISAEALPVPTPPPPTTIVPPIDPSTFPYGS
jgi:hypothetical protein